MASSKVIIVGAGPGGLAASLLLAASGVPVRIVERLPHVGGRTSAIRAGGFRFDLGPTFFLYPRVLGDIFATIGRDLFTEIPMVRLDPQYRVVFGAGGHLDATPVITRMEEQLAKFSPIDARAFRRFMEDNRDKLARFRPCLESPFLSARDLCTPRLMALLPKLAPWRSLDAELGRYFSDPRLRLAFSFQSKYLGMSPYRCPSLFSILSYLEYEHGVFHPQGGCSAVTERMAEIATEMGVEIDVDEPVQEILFRGRRAVGVRTASGCDYADALVVNADFARAMERIVPDRLRRRWSDRRIARKRFSCSTYMMYLGVDGRFDDLPHHTIYISRDYSRNLDEIERQQVLSEDPSIYVQNACVTDESLAPKGQSTLYVLVPVPHQNPNVDWQRDGTAFRQVAMKQLAKVGLRLDPSQVLYEKIVTPADWDQKYEIHRGATFNLAHNLRQMLHLRPRNRFEEFEGMYLVGGGTHPGSGLPVIFESARISTRLLLEDLGIPMPAPVYVPTPAAALSGSVQ